MSYFNGVSSITMGKRKFKIPLLGEAGLSYLFDDPENWMVNVLRKSNEMTEGKGAFVDVGANIGQTLLKVKGVRADTVYLGFEPNPNCLHYLYSLVNVNRLSNVTLFPFGLSDRSGVGNLNFVNDSSVDSSAFLMQEFRATSDHALPVALMAFEDIEFLSKQKVQMIKIDVEGSELEVIKGMQSLIRRDKPLIVCEILPVYSDTNEFRYNRQLQLEDILSDLGYIKFRIHANGHLTSCKTIGIHDSMKDVNYLLCHEERRGEVGKFFSIGQ